MKTGERPGSVAVPLQLLHVRAGLREDADAPPIRRPSVQVERQVVELCWLTAGESRHLGGSWDGSQVVDSQEVSRLRRQTGVLSPAHSAPHHRWSFPSLSDRRFSCCNLWDKRLRHHLVLSPLRYLVGQQTATQVRLNQLWP